MILTTDYTDLWIEEEVEERTQVRGPILFFETQLGVEIEQPGISEFLKDEAFFDHARRVIHRFATYLPGITGFYLELKNRPEVSGYTSGHFFVDQCSCARKCRRIPCDRTRGSW